MSANPYPEYVDDLKVSVWDKKKGSLPPGELATDLKALQKKHDAVDWKQFDAGWVKSAKTAAELEQAYAQRDRVYRGSVFTLKRDMLAIAKLAKALEKGAAKPVLDAAKAIGKAANAYADAVDTGVDELKALFDKALGALPKAKDEEEDDEPSNVLLEPKRLLQALNRCKKDPELTMNFAYVDGKDKQPAVLALHPRMSGKKIFAALQADRGVKTGAFGSAWVQVDGEFKGTCLMLQLDKPLSGLVKKVKAPVKASGFKIAKAVLWSADGTVFEQEDETDETTAPGAPGTDAAAAGAQGTAQQPDATVGDAKALTEAFKERLKAVLALTRAAGDTEAVRQAKQLCADAGMSSSKRDWPRVDELMTQAEALLVGTKPATPSAAGATSPGTTAAGAPASGASTPDADAPMARGTAKAPPLDPAMAFRSRLTGLVPRMKPVEAAGGPTADQIKAKREEAVGLVRTKGFSADDLAKALGLLDEIDALIVSAGPSTAPTGVPKVATATGLRVLFQQTRLAWDQTRKQVQVELKKLESSVLAEAKDEPDFEAIANNSKVLYTVLDVLDERLMDKLDDALSAGTPEERTAFHQEAREIVDEYMDYVKSDELLRDIDDNGFVDMQIGAMLTERLTAMSAQLKSAVAA